ncbi:coniferyl aldehyde dehydrogenase [Pelomonas sp. KK5]|uniref:coniferyl aldehyde dehydrogenase n=1 Tax=Pelomonas sp. KK5 TaxID=1855730 RepID=UPI002100D7FE|nr:coniferyl aldehyde dehydrogenase [Pelomonas sp. KK5]
MNALTPDAAAATLLAAQRAAHATDPTPTHAVRIDRLDRLARLLEENAQAFVQAITQDFGHRSAHETLLAEVGILGTSIVGTKRHLKGWMKTRRVATSLAYMPGRNRLIRQPLGVVGVVAPWNYPLQLSLGPAIGAIAAGNRVLIKPSELTPAFSALLEKLVGQYFKPEEMAVVCGDAQVGAAFCALPFDHLVFTGSTAVGRKVAAAAAPNLTPLTLELGGKSPCIIDSSADLKVAAPRIAFGKLLNAGQTCIAPDYLLVPPGQGRAVAEALKAEVARMYPTIEGNPDYTSIISPRHRARLQQLLDDAQSQGATIVPLSDDLTPQGSRKFTPVAVLNPTPSMQIMQEEIFGPLLPIVEVADTAAAIAKVNAGDRPLALYWFGSDGAAREQVLRETIAGGVTINDCLWHIGQEAQPFGGVGASGMGAYHGEHGFRSFSKEKPVFIQARLNGIPLLHPPYGKTFAFMLKVLKLIA